MTLSAVEAKVVENVVDPFTAGEAKTEKIHQ